MANQSNMESENARRMPGIKFILLSSYQLIEI